MGNFKNKNIDFVRQALVRKMTKPLSVIALYPQNSSDTKLYVQVVSNATVIALRYISSTTVTKSITFTSKSLKEVVQEINQCGLPLKAVQLTEIESLSQGDILSTGSGFVEIPYGFTATERLTDRGIVLRAKKIAVRHKNNSNIRLLPPYFEDPSLPWYPRISNGSFSQKYNGKLYHFYVKEFDNQAWSSIYGKPFKDLKGITPTVLDANVYSLPRTPVFWNGENITVYNGDVPITQNVIEDIDINNGILYTKPGYYLQEDFTLDYTYLESSFVYKDVNINGHFCQNPFVIDKYVVIYLLPAESAAANNKKTVFHTIGNSIEEAINAIVLEDPSVPIAIIGAYNIQQMFSSDRVSILDTRSKGGGLVDNKGPKPVSNNIDSPLEPVEPAIESFFSEAYRFWDIGNVDGEHYPSSAAVIVEIPDSIKNVLSLSEIKSKATKYIAAGVYPSISYYQAELPSVTGLAAQISCAYNLDFSDTYQKSSGNSTLLNTIPSGYYGAGWFLNSIDVPSSILSTDWNTYDVSPEVTETEGTKILTVQTSTGVSMSYLKSTPIVGIEWKERSVIATSGDYTQYSPWETKQYLDTTEVGTGLLIKNKLSFGDPFVVKQYKDIRVHSPYITGNLTDQVSSSISQIVDKTFALQEAGTINIKQRYTSVTDPLSKENIEDYILTPSAYDHLFDLLGTPIANQYLSNLTGIGNTLLQSGIYNSGHYLKFFIQGADAYFAFTGGTDYLVMSYNKQIETLSKYLNYRADSWDAYCNSGLSTLTGLVNSLMSSTSAYGSFETAVPTYWIYYLQTGITYPFSGVYIKPPSYLSGTITDISTTNNLDYLYTQSLPAIFSTLIAHTGHIDNSTVRNHYSTAYELAKTNVISPIDTIINSTRTYSGLPIPTNWFLGHNRLGLFLGTNLVNMCKAYDYLAEHVNKTQPEYNTQQYTYTNSQYLNYIFSGIEKVLDTSYDAVYHNLLRGGIVEPDMALTLYGYGWYLNNWSVNYGLCSSLYSNDRKSKFELLFNNGLKQLIKNSINSDNQLLETTTINGETGPFYSSTPYKILYPISQAAKYSSEWKGITEALVRTITGYYGVSGLYYSDPFKNNDTPGKEYDILGGMISIYDGLTTSGYSDLWEPMSTGLNVLRACDFQPYQVSDLFTNYNSANIDSCIKELKSIGINTIRPQLNYSYWYSSGSDFLSKLSGLAEICVNNKIRLLPTLIREEFSGLANTGFMLGVNSGESYVSQIVTSIGNSPALVGWNVVSNPKPYPINLVNYNSIAYKLSTLSSKPIYTTVPFNELSTSLSGAVYVADTYNLTLPQNNPRYSALFIQANSEFGYFLNLLPNYNKSLILDSYGNGTYGDYEVAIANAADLGLNFVLSNLFTSGSYGTLYNDNTARNQRQVQAIVNLAQSHGIEPTGQVQQRSDFSDVEFYSTYYSPSYSGKDILSALSSWSYSSYLPNNTGDYRFRIEQLQVLSSGLDLINHKKLDPSYFVLPSILSNYECDTITFYSNTWDSQNFIANTGLAWMSSGSIDYERYNQLLYSWGTALKNIVNRIGLNG